MISDIRLQKFRSYTDETFELSPGVNIIVGPNASGKTNLLEALLVVSLGSSYRAKDSELVQFDKPWAKLEAHTEDSERTVAIKLTEGGAAKKTQEISGRTFLRLPLDKTLPVVLFEPSHLLLLTGAPELRREFLDNLLSQTASGYSGLRQQYRRTLAQRNALLKKDAVKPAGQLFAWNIRLSELGGQIAGQRQKLVEDFNSELAPIYKKLSGSKAEVSMSYKSSVSLNNYSSDMLKKLEANTMSDKLRGFTSHGPHRDDLVVMLGGHEAQNSASRGELRTLVLSIKILELKLIEKLRGKKPLLLLDDVFSELDGRRRQALTKFLQNYQTFITTTDADVVVQHFMDNSHVIPTAKTKT